MNIKTFFIILSYLLIIISLLFVVAISDLSKVSQKFKDIEYNRYLMFKKANELKQSSDDLTKYARAYTSTNDKKYKNIYFHILDIRNGIARRPLDYDSTYWEISQSIKSQHHPLGKPSSLISEMRKLPYLPFEFKKLDEAELNSNELVQVEVEAFNAIEGLFKDDDGSYSIQKAPDPLLAVSLLNSEQYNHAKEKIMISIDDLLHSLSSRTSIATTNQNNLILRAFDRLYFLLFITLLILILVAIIIKKKILNPIQYFTEAITSLKAGNKTIYKGKIYNDELGLMINNFYDMKEVIDDDLKRLTFALNAADQGWFDLNLQSGTITVSDEYAVMLGYEPDEFHSTLQEWQDNVHPDDKNAALDSVQECLTTKKATTYEYRRKNKQGDWIWLHSIGEVVEFDINDKPVRIIGVKTNITERKQHEIRENIRISVLELLVTNAPLQKILNAILSIVESDEPNILCSILLLDKEKKHLFTGAAPSLPDFYNQTLNGVEIGYGVGSCAAAAFTKKRVIVEDISTHPYWKRFTKIASKADLGACCSQPIIDSQGGVLGTFAIYHRRPNTPSKDDLKLIDFVVNLSTIAIEKSKINEQMLLAKRVFTSTHEGITVTDPMGIIIDVNPAFSKITGYSKEEAMGKNPSILNSGKHKPEFYKNMWQGLKKHNYWQGDVWNRKKNGELYAQSLTISALNSDNDDLVYYVALFSDVTHAKEQQEQLKLMAHYDVLTKLPNRALFIDRFNQAIAHSKRTNKLLAICFLDIDNFKPINDNYGHETGDRLLVEVSQRISKIIREEDTVSRQGGDEFAILLGNIDSLENCEQTLDRIHFALSQPYIFNNISHKITASSGFTLFPHDDANIDTLIRHADKAMYKAKLAGKHRYCLFNAEQDKKIIQKNTQLDEIQRALKDNEFQLYYQPKVNMKTGKVFGVEALIRWIHPEKGIIPPLDFLPLIERSTLELEIGKWVIHEALKQLEFWNKSGINIEVSINVSSYYLQSRSFLTELKNLLSLFPSIDPNNIQLEILESNVLSDLEVISNTIKICRYTLGLNIALDDFGTGYSSLTHLRNLEANIIKIDQTFIRDLLEDPNDYSIVDGIIGLSDSFHREVIAEGVETTEQGILLLLMGCEQAQGYKISKPIPAQGFLPWLSKYKPNNEWLTCGNSKFSQKERKIKILKLKISQWKKQFDTNIKLAPESVKHWPIMDKTICPCGTWIKRAQQEKLFAKSWLTKVNGLHEKLHAISDELLFQYKDGKINEARDGLIKLQVVFDKISRLL